MTVEMAIGLAVTVVGKFLQPLLKSGVDKLGEVLASEIGEEAGKKMAEVSESLWDKVKSIFTSDDEQETLEKFENAPDDYAGPVKDVLAEKLAADPDLLSTMEDLVNTPTQAGTAIEVMGDSNISSVIHAQNAKLSGGSSITGVSIGGGSRVEDVSTSRGSKIPDDDSNGGRPIEE